MVVDVNFGKTSRRSTRQPALVAVIVDHHHCTSRHYWMLTENQTHSDLTICTWGIHSDAHC